MIACIPNLQEETTWRERGTRWSNKTGKQEIVYWRKNQPSLNSSWRARMCVLLKCKWIRDWSRNTVKDKPLTKEVLFNSEMELVPKRWIWLISREKLFKRSRTSRNRLNYMRKGLLNSNNKIATSILTQVNLVCMAIRINLNNTPKFKYLKKRDNTIFGDSWGN